MTVPERVCIPEPTGDEFLDCIEARIIQALCRQVGRTEEGKVFAFAMGMATGRWFYALARHIDLMELQPIDFIATVRGRLATLTIPERARILRADVGSDPHAARRDIQNYLAID